ncbi:hypothetical protein A9G11_09680 [Gilliamella sp. wkB108]|uniref:TPM domain-containing protein n=1 Tax=Gilliamella sp. wkB108 TaxID=3120256 RepID=UPI00080D97B5|nr:TPM domain-containing protein [Gilliamella apicola]OCG20954.1 hypothetical protein A9G11_09680 [Gilliamella apicola]
MKISNYTMLSVMIKNIFHIFWLSLFFCFITVQADVSFPKKRGSVTDQVGILSSQSSKQISDKIMLLKNTQGVQIAVLIIPTTAPLTIEEYASHLFNHWQLGRYKIDDGVLLLVALDDSAVRIEVGYGLEGTLTDLTSKNILNDYLLPYFKQQRYEQGIEQAVDAIIAKIKHEPLPEIDHTQFYITKNPNDFGVIDIIAAIIFGISFYLWGAVLFKLLKNRPLKAGIFLVIILSITGYFGGFDINTWNGLEFDEEFLKDNLPYWVQVLLLKSLPSWMSVLMIFTVFLVSGFLCLILFCMLFILPFVIIIRWFKFTKLNLAIMGGLFYGIVAGIAVGVKFESLAIGTVTCLLVTILMGIGLYTGKIKPTHSDSSRGKNSSIESRSSYSHRSSSESSSSYSSSSSSSDDSGGGGRSGGGGASGHW